MAYYDYPQEWDDLPELLLAQPLMVLRAWRGSLREPIWIKGVANWENRDKFDAAMDKCDIGDFLRHPWWEWYNKSGQWRIGAHFSRDLRLYMERYRMIVKAIKEVEQREINELLAEAMQHEEALT
jgi:hypothetical protein